MMKIRILSQLISLILLVLVITLAAGCSTLYKAEQAADRIEDQVEQKADQVEEQMEQAVTPSGNTAALTEQQVQEIALNHAGFTVDQVTNLRIHYDVDDGRPEYEVDFVQGDLEYDYTIHAESGDILEFDKDSVYD